MSVSTTRLCAPGVCKLLRSTDLGESWIEVFDFLAAADGHADHLTTGQPYVTRSGMILVAVWNTGYYENGTTGLAIYRSQDDGLTWERAHVDAAMTYGKHIFAGDGEGELYLCAGRGGGGVGGRVAFTPASGVLLRSADHGATWEACLAVRSPTAVYDGASHNGTIVATARERGSVFRSQDRGQSWREIGLGASARSVGRAGSRLLVSSDSAVFVSDDDGITWTKGDCPIKNLVLRYPLALDGDAGNVVMTAVGWRSLILRADVIGHRWWVAADLSGIVKTMSSTRLAEIDEFLFIGDETAAGVLVRVRKDELAWDRAFSYSLRSRGASAGRLGCKLARAVASPRRA